MLNPPVNLDTLMEEWSRDSKIDETEPGLELLKISSLRSKYLKILSYHNLKVKQLSSEYSKLRRVKYEYYKGDLNNPDDLQKYGWEPWLKIGMKGDINVYLDGDVDLVNTLSRKSVHQEVVDICSDVIKELHSRTFQLRSFIDWKKFLSGNDV